MNFSICLSPITSQNHPHFRFIFLLIFFFLFFLSLFFPWIEMQSNNKTKQSTQISWGEQNKKIRKTFLFFLRSKGNFPFFFIFYIFIFTFFYFQWHIIITTTKKGFFIGVVEHGASREGERERKSVFDWYFCCCVWKG